MVRVKQQILAGFKNWGYKNALLQENYHYFDGQETRSVDLIGFSQPAYNSSTACIAAVDKARLVGTTISSYQLLGCPVLLTYDDSSVQLWKNPGTEVGIHEEVATTNLTRFFKKYEKEFSPESIRRAKTLGRVRKEYQLSFGDIGGLMGIVEEKEGQYLADLTERVIKAIKADCHGIRETTTFFKWLFQAAFWLIGAKILKDKQVERFKTLQIGYVEDLVRRVQQHYNAANPLDISNRAQKKAIALAASRIVEPVESFAHLTTESLAYVYENALVSKETRQALGTHATPSWLVNYIVWGELADWIDELPQDERIVLEPACGHAPFLTATTKLLSFLYEGDETRRHAYLKHRLRGIEKDSFAIEIARLGLTLADIPNPNGWNIQDSDIYADHVLRTEAHKARILLCNPPFEDFSRAEKKMYGNSITTSNKAAEVLAKTLPFMPPKSVFGVVLPQGFLHRKEFAEFRKLILDDFDLRTICVLPESGVFGQSNHPATVLLGRKVKSKNSITYIRVHKSNLESFKTTYSAPATSYSKNEFYAAANVSWRVSELKEIWNYCEGYPKFRGFAEVGRGIEYKNFSQSVKKQYFRGAVKGFGRFERRVDGKKKDIVITDLPDFSWLSLDPDAIANPRSGTEIGVPQVLANRQRSGANSWRIKGLVDFSGHPSTDSFLVIRPSQPGSLSLYVIFALVNSPYTNAYMFDHCMGRNNLEGILQDMPVPFSGQNLSKLEALARKYYEFDHSEYGLIDEEEAKRYKKQSLLEIDAEVLRLYNLPPRHERTLLDLFKDIQRKGVDFEFTSYYEPEFESYIPLHIYISEAYKKSTFENVQKWVNRNRTPQVAHAFKLASKERSRT